MGLPDLAARLRLDKRDYDKGLSDADRQTRQTTDRIGAMGRKATTRFTLPILLGFAGATKAASDLGEAADANTVIFGNQSKGMREWGDTMADAAGLATDEALQASAAFGNMFNTVGLATDASVDMSKTMVQLAGDMASFNNEDPSAMLERLRSGLSGEAEPLRRFGVLISAARVETKALELGLADASGEVSESAKVQARYAIILEDTAKQQGNFELTADGVANSARTMAAEGKNAAASFGEVLQPVTKVLLQTLTGVMGVFKELPGPVKTGIVALLGIGAAVGPILLVTANVRKLRAELALLQGQAGVGARISAGFSRLGISMRALGGAAVAAGVAWNAWSKAEERARENRSKMAAELADSTIPTLLKTGDTIAITAHDFNLLGLSFANNRAKIADTMEAFSSGAASAGETISELGRISGLTEEEIRDMFRAQTDLAIQNARSLGQYREFGQIVATATREGKLGYEDVGEAIVNAGVAGGELNALIAAIPDPTLRWNVQRWLENIELEKQLAAQTESTGETIRKFAGMTAEEFRSWRQSTRDAINPVDDALEALADRANLTATEVLRSLRRQTASLRDYSRNWETLLARGLPDSLIVQLQEMGIEGAGIVEALAGANKREFNAIIRQWKGAQRESRETANAIKGHLGEAVNQRYQANVEIQVLPPDFIGPLAPNQRRAAGPRQNFHLGGDIPGPPGREVLITAEAGERVLSRAEVAASAGGRGASFNISIQIDGARDPAAVGQEVERVIRRIASEELAAEHSHGARMGRMR